MLATLERHSITSGVTREGSSDSTRQRMLILAQAARNGAHLAIVDLIRHRSWGFEDYNSSPCVLSPLGVRLCRMLTIRSHRQVGYLHQQNGIYNNCKNVTISGAGILSGSCSTFDAQPASFQLITSEAFKVSSTCDVNRAVSAVSSAAG